MSGNAIENSLNGELQCFCVVKDNRKILRLGALLLKELHRDASTIYDYLP